MKHMLRADEKNNTRVAVVRFYHGDGSLYAEVARVTNGPKADTFAEKSIELDAIKKQAVEDALNDISGPVRPKLEESSKLPYQYKARVSHRVYGVTADILYAYKLPENAKKLNDGWFYIANIAWSGEDLEKWIVADNSGEKINVLAYDEDDAVKKYAKDFGKYAWTVDNGYYCVSDWSEKEFLKNEQDGYIDEDSYYISVSRYYDWLDGPDDDESDDDSTEAVETAGADEAKSKTEARHREPAGDLEDEDEDLGYEYGAKLYRRKEWEREGISAPVVMERVFPAENLEEAAESFSLDVITETNWHSKTGNIFDDIADAITILDRSSTETDGFIRYLLTDKQEHEYIAVIYRLDDPDDGSAAKDSDN